MASSLAAPTVVYHAGPYETVAHPALTWIARSFAASDSLLPATWIPQFFTADATLHFNNDALSGSAAILARFTEQMASLASMHHSTASIALVSAPGQAHSTLYHECTIEYRVKGDDVDVVVPGVLIADVPAGQERFSSFRVFLDPTALLARHQAVAANASAQSAQGRGAYRCRLSWSDDNVYWRG